MTLPENVIALWDDGVATENGPGGAANAVTRGLAGQIGEPTSD